MNRRIMGFHQDEFDDWVAELECMHTQHVRHQPPFQLRPWVATAEGRTSRVGAPLDCRKCDSEPEYLRENRALVSDYYSLLWNQWRIELIDQLLAKEFRFRGSLGVTTRGRVAFADYVRMVHEAFPDFHNAVRQVVAEENTIVARLTYSGTHRGEIFGLAATDRQISYNGVAIFTAGGRQLRSAWVLGDRYELMRQLA
jgi:steroid delta-isomerase-like uncharacterized protein